MGPAMDPKRESKLGGRISAKLLGKIGDRANRTITTEDEEEGESGKEGKCDL